MRNTRRLKRGGGFFDFFGFFKKKAAVINHNSNHKTLKNNYFKRKTKQFPKEIFKHWYTKIKPDIVPKNNSLLNNAFGKAPTGKASDYEVIKSNSSNERKEADRITADTLIHEMISLEEGLQYDFVFAYQKMKNIPLDKTIFKLSPEQLNELRVTVKKAVNDGKNINQIAVEIFNCNDETDFNRQLQEWESPNKLIKIGNVTKISQSYAGFLGRLIPHILRTDKELSYVYNYGYDYQCDKPSSNISKSLKNNCIIVYKNLSNYSIYSEGLDTNYYIVINAMIPQNYLNIKSDKFMMTSYIKDTFSEGLMTLIHPRLGFIIQQKYPNIWSNKYWISNKNHDSINRITLLTLQKYSALRRFYGTNDESWSSDLYKNNPFNPVTAYELKNIDINQNEIMEELIDNQVWVNSINEEQYKRRKASGDTYGIRYRTIKDLDKLLPTPQGFKPIFPWQVYDSKNKNKEKSKLRHKNILNKISIIKRNKHKNLANSKIAQNLGDTWGEIEKIKGSPQYATEEAMKTYYRNFFDRNPYPSVSILPPRLTEKQRLAPKPSRFPKILTRKNSNRMLFEPTQPRLINRTLTRQNAKRNLLPRLTEKQRLAPKPSRFPKILSRQNSDRILFEPRYIRRTRKSRK